jgi:hypothetical protein
VAENGAKLAPALMVSVYVPTGLGLMKFNLLGSGRRLAFNVPLNSTRGPCVKRTVVPSPILLMTPGSDEVIRISRHVSPAPAPAPSVWHGFGAVVACIAKLLTAGLPDTAVTEPASMLIDPNKMANTATIRVTDSLLLRISCPSMCYFERSDASDGCAFFAVNALTPIAKDAKAFVAAHPRLLYTVFG